MLLLFRFGRQQYEGGQRAGAAIVKGRILGNSIDIHAQGVLTTRHRKVDLRQKLPVKQRAMQGAMRV